MKVNHKSSASGTPSCKVARPRRGKVRLSDKSSLALKNDLY